MKKSLLVSVAAAALCAAAVAEERNTFAIVADSTSYDRCRTEMEIYRESITSDGLDAFILVDDWKSPEAVRDTLRHYHLSGRLEGAVFVGDIPVPMIRGAQHLTSAFKMDEKVYPMRESSVPSDRFYDDFDLRFNFLGRDSSQTNLFYYELAPESPQYIECDIYSGRIKPSGRFRDRYEELSAYLMKAAEAKKEHDVLDEITSYTGDGSFSNSLIAWKDETITLSEQMPSAFSGKKEARFIAFAMYPYVKDLLISEIQRPELDLVLFHEHGMPERQYLSGYPEACTRDGYYEMGRFHARALVKQRMRYGSTFDEAVGYAVERTGLDRSWFSDALDPDKVAADSLFDLRTGIVLEDIDATAPNVRMSVFDACYNGDFREDDCVASRYVMSGGDAVVAIGNSVNVLQDKSSSDLMGMLSAGYRVGEWMQNVNILESHVFGDPTFHFASSYSFCPPDIRNRDTGYWKKYLGPEYPCDINALALHKLYSLGCPGLSELLLDTYRTSPYYMLRLQCMHLLAHYNDGNYTELLKEAADDPYEFIRRKAAYYMGKVGSAELADCLAEAYLNDCNSKRVAFNIGFAAGHFPDSTFNVAFSSALEKADFILDKEEFSKEADALTRSSISMMESTARAIADRDKPASGRSMYISGMRNNPYPHLAAALVGLMEDDTQELALRVQAADVLGWYVRAWNRGWILAELEEYLKENPGLPEELRNMITKSSGCLADYMK